MATKAVLTRPSVGDADTDDLSDLAAGLFVVASAPAGWYDIDDDMRRWFDGRGWTDHYAPILKLVPGLDPVLLHISTSHGFHAIMVIMTLGVWAPIWLTVGVCNLVRSTERSRALAPCG